MNSLQARTAFEQKSRAHVRVAEGPHGPLVWTANRFWLEVEEADTALTPNITRDGFWEAWVSIWMEANLLPGTSLIDVGANIGYFSLLAASRGNNVLAVEPNPQVAAVMLRSVQVNSLLDRFVLLGAAAADVTMTMDLHIPEGHSGAGSLMLSGQRTMPVLVCPLDTVWPALRSHLGPVGVVKIDAEGAELLAWRGMTNLLRENEEAVVTLEWAPGRFVEPHEVLEEYRRTHTVRVIDGAGAEVEITDEELLQPEMRMLALRAVGS